MVRHIVIWKIKDTTTREDLVDLKKRSEALKSIPGVISLDFEIDPIEGSTHNMCLNAVYESKEALDTYKTHPVHVEFGTHLRPLVCERVAFDYNM